MSRFTRPMSAISLMLIMLIAATQLANAGVIPQLPSTRVSDTQAEVWSEKPDIVEANGVLYSVWQDRRDGDIGVSWSIYFAKSTDQGATWSQNVRVSVVPDDDWSNSPTVAVTPNGDVWVVWHVYYNDQSKQVNDVRLARSTDGGATFSQQNVIFDGLNGDTSAWQSRLVINPDSGHAHVLTRMRMTDGTDYGFTLLVATSEPPYATWTVAEVTDDSMAGRIKDETLDDGPWLSMDQRGNMLCVAWEDVRERFSIYGACSTDNGTTFGTNFRISGSDALVPEIAIGVGGELYAIYHYDEDFDNNIYLRRSTDMGATWSAERLVTQDSPGEVEEYDIVVDANGQVVIGWSVDDFGSDLYLTTTLDKGQTFASALVSTGESARNVSMTTYGTGDDTYVQALYTGNSELRTVRAILDGIAPSTPTNVRASGEEVAIQLTWNAASDANGVYGYRVLRAAAADAPFTEITNRVVEGLSFVDVEVAAGATWHYRVFAVDSTGNLSDPSPVVSATARALAAPQQTGWLAWEDGNSLRVRNFASGETQTLTEAHSPQFSASGARLYYRTGDMIASRPPGGGEIQNFFEDPELSGFDIAANDSDFASLIGRRFASTVTGGFCFVYEPRHGRPGVERYVNQYELAESIAISADAAWMAYVSHGWCNVSATSVYFPERLCMVNLATTTETCAGRDGARDTDFAPSGHKIVYADALTGQSELWTAEVQADGSLAKFVQITRGGAGIESRAPSWSSDGQWIVFQRDMDTTPTGENWQLYVVRADGVGMHPLGITGESPALHGSGGTGVPGATLKVYLPTVRK